MPPGADVAKADVKQGVTALNPTLLWGPGLGDEIARSAGSGGMFSGGYVYPAAGFVQRDGSVTRFAGAAASTAGAQQGAFRYAGVTDHYFVSAILDPSGSQRVDFARATARCQSARRARLVAAGVFARKVRSACQRRAISVRFFQ